MNIIEIRGLKKDYSLGNTTVNALRGIDLDVVKGDLLSIVGPSGSGKTTLLNVIGCIDHPTQGSVKIADQEVSTLKDKQITDLRLHRLGFIFQTFNLIPVLTAVENVEFPLLLARNVSKKKARQASTELLTSVGLADYLTHRPAELSGGQRQRVAIARALVTEPDIVLADEPTANLDSTTGASILNLMKRMNERLHTTFIFSTHDPNVMEYARNVVKIHDGLVAEG